MDDCQRDGNNNYRDIIITCLFISKPISVSTIVPSICPSEGAEYGVWRGFGLLDRKCIYIHLSLIIDGKKKTVMNIDWDLLSLTIIAAILAYILNSMLSRNLEKSKIIYQTKYCGFCGSDHKQVFQEVLLLRVYALIWGALSLLSYEGPLRL